MLARGGTEERQEEGETYHRQAAESEAFMYTTAQQNDPPTASRRI